MATSGVVGQYTFNLRKVMDHSFRRARLVPQMNSSENLAVAKDLVFLLCAEWINAGFPLWTRRYDYLGITAGKAEVPCVAGTVDVFHTYWNILMPWRGAAQSGTGTDISTLCSGQPEADVVIPGANPSVVLDLGSATQLDTIGVLLGGSSTITTALKVYTSVDGSAWTLSQTLESKTYAPQSWVYHQLSPSTLTQYVKLEYVTSGSWTLSAINFCLSGSTSVEIGPLNIDDYWNLPDKQFQSNQPNSAYDDRRLTVPVAMVWPVPNTAAFYGGTVSVLCRRYIQDPGALVDDVEVPPRWLEGLISRLAVRLDNEIERPQAKDQYEMQDRLQLSQKLESQASKAEALMWAEERTRGPIKIVPNFSCYTR